MKRQSLRQKIAALSRVKKVFVFVFLAVFLASGIFGASTVGANSISDQIEALKRQNEQNRAAVEGLEQTAVSYQDAISQLQGQISQLQGQINANLARQEQLKKDIEANELELQRQRAVLGTAIKTMYVDGDISTIEMLATSKNLSDFIDKDTYRTAVQNKIQDTLKKITKLQEDLGNQKTEVEALLADQRTKQASLQTSRNEQSRLLSLNERQQSDFNQKTKDNQARIEDLIAQQRRANQSAPSGGYYFIRFPGSIDDHDVTVDDYPYRNAGFSMQLGPCSNSDNWPDSPDRWGYCTRQCVSYTAWAVERSGRSAPMYYGSAKNWIDAAPASWIHRDPQPGDVAITTAGTWGHAMYVEKVEGNRIFVSQYNNSLNGEYSTQWRTFR